MASSSAPSMVWPRLLAFVLAALAAGSAVFWALQWQGATAPKASGATAASALAQPLVNPQAVARALGGSGGGSGSGAGVLGAAGAGPANAPPPSAAVLASSRMALAGVVSGTAKRGTALIAIDGKPARPFAVGAAVDGGLLVQAVEPRRVHLAPQLEGPATVTLELPAAKPRP